LGKVLLAADIAGALRNADAAVICTEWLQFHQADWAKIVPTMRQRVFVDANRFLEKELKSIPGVEHLSVGRA
jgi:UDP-glucose 6-dehydrogenase